MDALFRKRAAKTARYAGMGLWFVLKIAVYLLVAYSVVFSVAVTAGAFWAKNRVEAFVESVERLKEENPERSLMMERVLADHSRDTSFRLEHRFVPLDSISPLLVRSVIASEDAAFRLHPGIDIEALLAALQTNRERGRNSFGGSTITQQLAKNLFLDGDDKSFKRKAFEAVYALLMERKLGKDRILELYLNYAQWGENVFGVEAAARHYYRCSAYRLGFEQSVRLASILANPERFNPHSTKSVFLSQRRAVIYNNLLSQRVIDSVTWAALRADSVARRPDSGAVPGQEGSPAAQAAEPAPEAAAPSAPAAAPESALAGE